MAISAKNVLSKQRGTWGDSKARNDGMVEWWNGGMEEWWND